MHVAREHIEDLLTNGFTRVKLDNWTLLRIRDAYVVWERLFGSMAKKTLKGDGLVPWGYVPLQTAAGWSMKESYYCRPNEWLPPVTRDETRELITIFSRIMAEVAALLNEVAGAQLVDGSAACLRMMRYPGLRGDRESSVMRELTNTGMMRANAHIDLNVLTALTPPTSPGLQIQCGGKWKTIDEDPSVMIIQTGKELDKRSRGKYGGCVHRVLNPIGIEEHGSRFVAAYFVS